MDPAAHRLGSALCIADGATNGSTTGYLRRALAAPPGEDTAPGDVLTWWQGLTDEQRSGRM